MAHDNIKSHKRKGLHLSLEDTFFEKPQGEGANWPSPSLLREISFQKQVAGIGRSLTPHFLNLLLFLSIKVKLPTISTTDIFVFGFPYISHTKTKR